MMDPLEFVFGLHPLMTVAVMFVAAWVTGVAINVCLTLLALPIVDVLKKAERYCELKEELEQR